MLFIQNKKTTVINSLKQFAHELIWRVLGEKFGH
jgi:hypothetical protein